MAARSCRQETKWKVRDREKVSRIGMRGILNRPGSCIDDVTHSKYTLVKCRDKWCTGDLKNMKWKNCYREQARKTTPRQTFYKSQRTKEEKYKELFQELNSM